MQKEARESDRTSIREKSSSKSGVGNIFRTMAYNENQVENFSTISSWLSEKGDTLVSIINGKAVVGSSSAESKTDIRGKVVSVAFLDAKFFDKAVLSPTGNQDSGCEKSSWDEKGSKERLGKFEELLKSLIVDLCVAEGIATGTPSWQIREYDQPGWNVNGILSNETSSFANVRRVMHRRWENKKPVHAIMRLQRESYCFRNVLSLLIPALEFDGKFSLTISLSSALDASSLLPTALLIDALNKSMIRKSPIDLLLIEDSTVTPEAVLKFQESGTLFVGDIHNKCLLDSRIISGAIKPTKLRSLHFIVDCSADVKSAVEAIVTKNWCSGSSVNLRARSLLFVHQPIYNSVIELLKKKIGSLKISTDPTHRSSDFIKRTFPQSIDVQKILAGGKMLPESGDLSSPVVIYDIGTSSDLVANRFPGFGHVLCVIPYRSSAELFSLSNNHGSTGVQAWVHASNSSVLKEIATHMKVEEIWMNSSGKYNGEEGLDNINNWALLLPSHANRALCPPLPSQGKDHPLQTGKDEFLSGVLGAEKSLKPWSSTRTEKRSSIADRVLLSVLKNESDLGESDRILYLIDLMRMVGQPFNNGPDNDGDDLTILRTKPIGIVAIVLVNPEKLSLSSSLLPILSATMKGNAAIVISATSSVPQSIVEACNSNFPVGLVNFIRSSTVTDSFTKLAQHCGKVSLVCLVQDPDGEGTRVDQIPVTPFTSVTVDHYDFIKTSPPSAQALQVSKIIHW